MPKGLRLNAQLKNQETLIPNRDPSFKALLSGIVLLPILRRHLMHKQFSKKFISLSIPIDLNLFHNYLSKTKINAMFSTMMNL